MLLAAIVIVASTASAASPSETGPAGLLAGALELVVAAGAVDVAAARALVAVVVGWDWVASAATLILASRSAMRPAPPF
ncbi:MAG TPA: hypothetical protein VMF07_14855 [Solirubrobacteraceae bacterium]|nr:hypothetical protein [Solirubrobacteraceae bacterium]